MRTKYVVGGLFLLVLLTVAHWVYWYRPRERPGSPQGSTIPGRVFVDADLPYRVWMPYPHQNLAELEKVLGDIERLTRSLARLTGRAMPRLPSFGGARLPPSSELVLASDATGERFVAAARVYPVAGFLARWAGRLAGNPLLAGGRTEIDGRPVEVEWVDGTWVVATLGVATTSRVARPAAASGGKSTAEALTWIALARPRGRIPAGEYRLLRRGRDLLLEGGDAATLERLAELAGQLAPMPLLTVESFAGEQGFGARALGLLPGVRSIGGLPGAATASRGPRRWRLPGERVLDVLGDGAPEVEIDGWRVVALEQESLSRAPAVVEFTRQLEAYPPLSVAVWIELREARRLIDQVVEALEAVPIIGRREARRWRAAAVVLEPLARYQRLTAVVSADPAAVTVRLERRRSQ